MKACNELVTTTMEVNQTTFNQFGLNMTSETREVGADTSA